MSADPNRPSASSSSSFYYQQQHQQQQQQQAGDDQDNIQLKPPIKKMRSFDTGTTKKHMLHESS